MKLVLNKLKNIFGKVRNLKGRLEGMKAKKGLRNRLKSKKDYRIRKRAEYLSTLPINPVKRFFYRLHPKRVLGFMVSRKGLLLMFKLTGIALAVGMVSILGIFAYFRKDLPDISNLNSCSQGAGSSYYDRTGETLLWISSGDVECYPVSLEEISQHLKNAVITAEDRDFYTHGGFSIVGIFRAAINDLRGGSTQGGSTITQQFVKNSMLTQERSIQRKIKELILSLELERSYSKDAIYNAYLNEIPFGSVFNGAEAAARGYFNKSAKDLTLDESAMLAAIIPAPTYYSPYGSNTEELNNRKNYVIDTMVEQGFVKREDAEAAKKVDTFAKLATTHSQYKDILAPHFVLEVQEQLEKEYGASNLRKAGYKITTTVDLRLQKLAEEAIKANIYKVDRDGGNNAAMVSVDVATNQVLALVGSRDFTYPKFGELNMATTPRSPGSSFKPYDYAGLMSVNKNWGAGSILYDLNTVFDYGYKPKDYDFKEPGALTMRQALGGSRNTPAIKAMYIAGVQNIIDTAKKMGVVSGTSCEPSCGLSSAIGDGSEIRLDEHVSAYATFARMGKAKPLTYVLKIKDRKDKVIREWKDTVGTQAIDPQVAYTINNMLSDDSVRYIRGSRNFNYNGITTALKTGTTNNMDNGWLMMYSTKIATGVWIGHHENKAMWCGVYGCMEGKTGSIMASYMPKAHEGVAGSGDKWTKPDGMKTVCINPTTGYATSSGGKCDIFPSWYQPRYPDESKKATIDIVSNKLATECTPELAKQTITGGGILSELPTSDPLYNSFMKPITARYGSAGGSIPTENDDIHTCDPDDMPSITLSNPTVSGGSYTFKATVKKGKYDLKTVNFKKDGGILQGGSFDVTESGTVTFKYIPEEGSDGTATITAEVIDTVYYQNEDSWTGSIVAYANNVSDNRNRFFRR